MPRSQDFLRRFRPAGTPGAAAAAGVPADRVAELTSELEPVLQLLAGTQDEVARIRQEAQDAAEKRRREAAAEAGALVAGAHRDAAGERADAALQVSREAAREREERLRAAEAEAAAIRARAAARMEERVARALAAAREALAAEAGP